MKRLRSLHLRQQRAGGLNVAASGLDLHDALALLLNSLLAGRDVALGVMKLFVKDGAVHGRGIRPQADARVKPPYIAADG
jgi:hypothetical protein